MSSQLLPPNSTLLERTIADATAIELDTDGLRHAESAALCPPQLLPWLAWERSVEDWGDDWSLDVQRRAVASSVQLHSRKGTVWAVKRAIALAGYRSQISEWWQCQHSSAPHTFHLDIDVVGSQLVSARFEQLLARIDAVKPARSHYSLRFISSTTGTIRHAAAVMCGESISIFPYSRRALELRCPAPVLAIGVQSWITTEVRPR